MSSDNLKKTISSIANFYDARKVGYEGTKGYRKSTDLIKLDKCIQELVSLGLIDVEQTIFTDLGCADGRVNLLMSYFVKKSIGIELHSDILSEFIPRKKELLLVLQTKNLPLPPENIFLFHGNSLESSTYYHIFSKTGIQFADVDLFYTYITLHDLFAEKIAEEAKTGALYLVYGFNKVLPRYHGLETLIPDVASQGIAALYKK